jgi:hypothetical protein
MNDTYEINELGQVVPYTSGRRCNDTRSWRDATELELAQKQELEELRADMEQCKNIITNLRKTVVRYRWQRDEAKALLPNAVEKEDRERSINVVRGELKEAGIANITEGPAKVAKHIDRATREFHTVAKALGYDWLSGGIIQQNAGGMARELAAQDADNSNDING